MRNIKWSILIWMLLCMQTNLMLAQKICFFRNGAIWISNIDGKQQHCLMPSSMIDEKTTQDYKISPDGKYISFTKFICPANSDKYEAKYRAIALYSIDSNYIRILDNAPKMNNYSAQWSPDSKYLAFFYPHEANPTGVSISISIITRYNTEYSTITDSFSYNAYTTYFFAWLSDSKSLLCEMDSLYHISIDGKILGIEPFIDLSSETTDILTSTATNMSISPDDKYISFDGGICDNGSDILNATSAIWIFDRITKKITRITPKYLSCLQPNWTKSGDAIIFYGYRKKTPNIYKYDLKTKKIKLLLKNASEPSLTND